MARGASRAVVRALTGEASPQEDTAVPCPRCGAVLDFSAPDPLRIGRQMQRCTNAVCPDRVLRAVPRRHVGATR